MIGIPGIILGLIFGWVWSTFYSPEKRKQPLATLLGALLTLAGGWFSVKLIQTYTLEQFHGNVPVWAELLVASMMTGILPDIVIVAAISSHLFRKGAAMRFRSRTARINAAKLKAEADPIEDTPQERGASLL